MKFSFELDYKRLKLSEQAIKEAEEFGIEGKTAMFENTLNALLQSMGGVQGAKLRTMNRILNKLDEASEASIELEQAEVDFLRSVFFNESINFPPQTVRAVGMYQAQLEKLC